MTSVTQCPPNSLISFPIGLDITPSQAIYESARESILVDFKWSQRSTPPSFVATSGNSGVLDEVGTGNSNVSTIRFQSENYSLESAQICSATHKNWLVSATEQSQNMEDFICIFKTDGTTTYKYITFVIPIARSTDATDSPLYLSGLSSETVTGPFSLKDMFPSDPKTQFAFYATCLKGSSQAELFTNMRVFVCTQALIVPATTMKAILNISNISKFPTFVSPFGTLLTPSQISSIGIGFSTYVKTTIDLLNAASARESYQSLDVFERSDSTNAYKCVPLDPDKDIVDGQITVDTRKGTVLSNVLQERDALKGKAPPSIGPGRVEKYLGSALGVILSVILFGGIIYMLLVYFLLSDKPTSGPVVVPFWKSLLTGLPLYIILTVLAGFVGFVIGMSLT